jgi:hypothetical protein
MIPKINFLKASFILIKMYYDEQSLLKRGKGKNSCAGAAIKISENGCGQTTGLTRVITKLIKRSDSLHIFC